MVRKLKKPIAFLLSFAMIMTVLLDFPGNTFGMITAGLHASAEEISPAKPDVGEGTEASPYEIDSAQELYWFAALVDGTLTDGTAQNVAAWAKLTANITVNTGVLKEDGTLVSNTSGFAEWTPIATRSKSYSGTFDGQGYEISGLYCNKSGAEAISLFGALNTNGKILNVGVVDSYFSGNNYVGGICAYSCGEITNCYNNSAIKGSQSVGGICGLSIGSISDCHNAGKVFGATSGLGGICGKGSTNITNCYNTGALSAKYNIGGILGYRDDGIIKNCFSTGTVTCEHTGVGGICGHDDPSGTSADPAYINCYYDSEVFTGFAVDLNKSVVENVLGKSSDKFANGEVAYLLNGDQSEISWGQEIGVDKLPVKGGMQVYATTGCITFSNDPANVGAKGHDFSSGNGICDDCGAYEPAEADEDGIYQISSVTDLYWFAQQVNGGNTSLKAVLTNDIKVNEGVLKEDGTLADDPSGFRVWTPIGNAEAPFSGTFDGRGKTIYGLYIDSTKDFVGLFGVTAKNSVIANVAVSDSYFKGNGCVGGICGSNSSVVQNCINNATVVGKSDVGGLFGVNMGIIAVAINSGHVTGVEYVGGVCGYHSDANSDTYIFYGMNDGTVTGEDNVGGICGESMRDIKLCSNTGEVNGNNHVGGILGRRRGGLIGSCYNAGAINCKYGDSGSIFGNNLSDNTVTTPVIVDCYYNTDIYAYGFGANDFSVFENFKGKNTEQFASGEVAYLLNANGNQGGIAWGQEIGVDKLPVLGGMKVYATTGCVTYSNDPDNIGEKQHKFINGSDTCSFCGSYIPADADENGIYQIDSVTDLYWFAQQVNSGNNSSIKAVLTTDITVNEGVLKADGTLADDTSGFRVWTPIGKKGYIFEGEFDGQGHTISGLYVNDPEATRVGLFGSISDTGTIKNVGVIDSYFYGDEYVGGISGSNDSTITNCYSICSVNGNTSVGGICGYNPCGKINNCFSAGTVSAEKWFGGVCGYNYEEITNSYYDSDVFPGPAIGLDYGTVSNVVGWTAERFASGEAAYILNGDQSVIVWGQEIGVDKYPVFGGMQVYATTGCVTYSNDPAKVGAKGHDFSKGNGICDDCGAYEPADSIDDVYQISSVTDLYWFAEEVNSGNTSISAVLTTDITVNTGVLKADGTLASDTSGFKVWTPIGNSKNKYTGTFDGKGYKISGLYINDEKANNVGLFGYLFENGKICNLGIEDSYFCGYEHVGGVCAVNDLGSIMNCSNAGTICGNINVGGVCGFNTDALALTECYNTGTVSGDGNVGGICGYNIYATIDYCYNTGTVSGDGNVGGICGYNTYNGKIISCFSVGTISGASGYAGGVCGYSSYTASVKYCYFDKTVYSGDAVGYNGGTPTSVLGKSSDKFANGEVAYLLNGDQSNIIWGQTINSDKLPVIGGAQVYATTGCMTFSNDSAKTEAKDHDFSKGNGICNDCGAYEPAESVDGVYQIDSVTDLYWFAEQVNSGNTSYNAVLTADITVNSGVIDSNGNLASDTTGFMQWTPMGTSNKPYKGIFDGQGHKISGLYCNTPSTQYAGFFGRIGTGTIKNLGVVDSYFLGKEYVGGICGYSVNGIISGCYSISAVYGEYGRGGICGTNDSGAITNCCSNSDIGPLDAVGSYYDDSRITNTISKTTDEFERGVAAYVLNGGESPAVWGQEIGVDKLPVFGGMPVYATTGCVTYSNDPAKTGAKEHDFSKGNGICDDCGAHQPALSVNGVYQISNANELYWFAEEVNSGNTSINAVLTANIKVNEGVLNSDGTLASDTSGFKKWMPIGYNYKNEYIGTFDGQGHTISGLYVNLPTSSFIGLFGNLGSNGTIKNVGVVNSYLSGSSSVGGICGFSDGTITGCYNTSTVIGTTDIIGGIAGYNGNTVSDCYNTGKVDGAYEVGGICGVSADNTSDDIVTISNCYNSGTISGAESVGGVCGSNLSENENSVSTIIYCYNTGNVRSASIAGGISGNNYNYGTDTVIKYCYNTGAVTSTEDAAGGICGENGNGTIEYCYNTGSVSSAEEYGAICSSNYYGDVQNCYFDKYVNKCGAIGYDESYSVTNALGFTTDKFTSGEVAYLLNGDQSTIIWKQNIGEDKSPAFTGGTVYRNQAYEGCIHQPGTMSYVYNNSVNDPIYTGYYAETVVKPTYTEKGYTLHECTTCGDSYIDNYTDRLLLPAVKNLAVAATTETSVTLRWAANTNANGYIIEKLNGSAWERIITVKNNSTTTYTVTGLSEATEYRFRVTPYVMPESTVLRGNAADISAKTAPTGTTELQAVAATNGTAIRLIWNKNETATGYIIDKAVNGAWVNVATIANNSSVSYTVSGLEASTSYRFRVTPYTMLNETVIKGTGISVTGKTAPSALTGLVATAATNGTAIRLTWDKNSTATGYIIDKLVDGNWVNITTYTSNASVSYTVSGLDSSTAYRFRVTPYTMLSDSVIKGTGVSVTGKTAPTALTGLAATAATNGTAIRLTWEKNSTVSGYIIEKLVDGNWVSVTTLKNNSYVSYTVSGLDSSTAYRFRVTPYTTLSGNIIKAAGVSVSGKTAPAAISGLEVSKTTADSITLSWEKNTTSSGYVIEMLVGNSWESVVTVKSSSTTGYTVTGLSSSTSYRFRVTPFTTFGDSTIRGMGASVTGRTL